MKVNANLIRKLSSIHALNSNLQERESAIKVGCQKSVVPGHRMLRRRRFREQLGEILYFRRVRGWAASHTWSTASGIDGEGLGSAEEDSCSSVKLHYILLLRRKTATSRVSPKRHQELLTCESTERKHLGKRSKASWMCANGSDTSDRSKMAEAEEF